MISLFFKSQSVFRNWLKKNHKKETELLVGFYKVDSGKMCMNWSQSVDEALSFGWIDGIRKSIDAESYTIRFTPRKKLSNWSAVNIKKAEELIQKGLMQPAGLELFRIRREDKSAIYRYENKPKDLPAEFEKVFKKNKKAWNFFSEQAPYYKRTLYYWILSPKQEATKKSRLEKVINASEEMKKLR